MPSTTAEPLDDQASLFTVTAPDHADAVASGVRFLGADLAAAEAALEGDGYGWLTAVLPDPAPPLCESCRRRTTLAATAPVLWTCPHCHPRETQ